jgi:hypothetical protein
MATTLIRYQARRNTAAAWTSTNEVLLDGEPGYESDTGKFKIGDGSTAWAGLGYAGGATIATGRNPVTGWYHAAGYGLTTGGNAATNTTALQNAIDAAAAAGGGVVVLPDGSFPVTTITLKSNVTVRSFAGALHYSSPQVTLSGQGGTGTVVIDTPATNITSCAVSGIQIAGGNTASIGIRLRNVNFGKFENLLINGFADQGIVHVAGFACSFTDLLLLNCLRASDRATIAGVVELQGCTDDLFSKVEVSGSQTARTTTGNSSAWLIAGNADANFFTQCIGEIADTGWTIAGHFNQFTGCRGDLNWGHGFEFTGAGGAKLKNMLTGCHALNNGRATANTYSGFKFGFGTANILTGCRTTINGSAGASHKYGFDDSTEAYADATFRNIFVGCDGDYATALFGTSGSKGPAVSGQLAPYTATAAETAIDVSHIATILFNNTVATTVTAFTGGLPGRLLLLASTNTNTTLGQSATIATNTGASKVLQPLKTYLLGNFDGNWREITT